MSHSWSMSVAKQSCSIRATPRHHEAIRSIVQHLSQPDFDRSHPPSLLSGHTRCFCAVLDSAHKDYTMILRPILIGWRLMPCEAVESPRMQLLLIGSLPNTDHEQIPALVLERLYSARVRVSPVGGVGLFESRAGPARLMGVAGDVSDERIAELRSHGVNATDVTPSSLTVMPNRMPVTCQSLTRQVLKLNLTVDRGSKWIFKLEHAGARHGIQIKQLPNIPNARSALCNAVLQVAKDKEFQKPFVVQPLVRSPFLIEGHKLSQRHFFLLIGDPNAQRAYRLFVDVRGLWMISPEAGQEIVNNINMHHNHKKLPIGTIDGLLAEATPHHNGLGVFADYVTRKNDALSAAGRIRWGLHQKRVTACDVQMAYAKELFRVSNQVLRGLEMAPTTRSSVFHGQLSLMGVDFLLSRDGVLNVIDVNMFPVTPAGTRDSPRRKMYESKWYAAFQLMDAVTKRKALPGRGLDIFTEVPFEVGTHTASYTCPVKVPL